MHESTGDDLAPTLDPSALPPSASVAAGSSGTFAIDGTVRPAADDATLMRSADEARAAGRRAAERAGPAPTVEGYEILHELGRGGMGVVYKALQTTLNRVVALKMILDAAHAGAEQRLRFRAEAEAIASLQHPNIVQIYDWGEQDGRPYFALEFIDGGSLDRRLAGTPLPPAEAVVLIETLARAMHVAHQRNIIHRDLKPANVLLSAAGAPKITDFGLAKQLDSQLAHTMSGAILGTPSYMAPEQAAGKGAQIGPATDVYALGAILYETLTGRPPFKGPSAWDTMQQVISDDPVPPSKLQPKLPRDLETVCLKCLAKAPAQRYGSAMELAEDLRRYQVGEPIQARPTALWRRLWKWAERRPARAFIGVLGGVAVIRIVLSIWYSAGLLEDARRDARQSRAALHQQRDELRTVYAQLLDLQARQGDASGLETNAARMLAVDPDNGMTCYRVARAFALAADAPSSLQPQRAAFAARAMELLGKAQTLGAFQDPRLVQELAQDEAFRALREREDFQKLLKEAQGK